MLEEGLGERADAKWAAFEVGLCCPRQNGKSAVLEALMLGSLFFDGGETLYSAHEFKTAQRIWGRLDGMVRGTPQLNKLVKRRVTSTNEMSLELHNGAKLQFVARSGTSGRGFTADRVIFDEAMILSSMSMTAMVPTMNARPNGQIWYAGSAGLGDSEHWRAVRDRGRSENPGRMAWFEWAGERPDDLEDRVVWAERNPGYPFRLTDEALADSLVTLSVRDETLDGWVREQLGVWDLPDGATAPVIPADIWDSHAEPDRHLGRVSAFALDVSPNRSTSALAVAGDADGRPMVEIPAESVGLVDHRPGTSWVVPRLADLAARYEATTVYLTGTASEALRPELEHAGLTVRALTGPELAAACGLFFDAATEPAGRGLVHAGQPELAAALSLARRAETDHGWQWGRRKSAGDITPLVAATVALWAHTTAARRESFIAWR